MPLTPFPPTANPIPEGARATRVPSKYIPQLSLKERDRRWDRARKAMLMAGIDAFIFLGNDIYWGMGMANMRYMFQVDAHLGADGLFPLSGEPVVWSGVPHMNRPTNPYLSLNTWITDFRTRGGMPAVVDELKARGLDKSKLGLVAFSSTIQTTPTLLHQDVLTLEKLQPHAELVDPSHILQDMRVAKELLNIWNVSVECLEASKGALVAGKTIREALEIIRKPAAKAGLDWVELGFHAMGTASPEFPTVVYAEGYGSNTLNGHRIMDFVLEEGMCFGNNVDLHDSRWKPDVGTMLSDFMVVRPNKAECLIGTPTEFVQKG